MATATTRSGRGVGWAPAIAGMALIATTYGLARFGVGLFAPRFAEERPDLVGVLGWAAAAQFAAYAVSAVIAGRLARSRPRAGLVLAGTAATTGCIGVAFATHPALFVAAVLIGGMGGGFASPALVPVIDRLVRTDFAPTAQSVANSGTAVGVIAAGSVTLTGAAITPAWLLMALACAASAVAMGRQARHRGDPPARRTAVGRAASGDWRALLLPGLLAAVVGVGSALVWTFGPLIINQSGAVASAAVGWLWFALGVGGVLGVLSGTLVAHAGRSGGWSLCAAALTAATVGVALSVATGEAWIAYASMAVFGAGYMGLSSVLVLWAREVWPSSAGAGTSALFIALAIGQALGSAGFGEARAAATSTTLALVAAGPCAVGGVVPLLRRR